MKKIEYWKINELERKASSQMKKTETRGRVVIDNDDDVTWYWKYI